MKKIISALMIFIMSVGMSIGVLIPTKADIIDESTKTITLSEEDYNSEYYFIHSFTYELKLKDIYDILVLQDGVDPETLPDSITSYESFKTYLLTTNTQALNYNLYKDVDCGHSQILDITNEKVYINLFLEGEANALCPSINADTHKFNFIVYNNYSKNYWYLDFGGDPINNKTGYYDYDNPTYRNIMIYADWDNLKTVHHNTELNVNDYIYNNELYINPKFDSVIKNYEITYVSSENSIIDISNLVNFHGDNNQSFYNYNDKKMSYIINETKPIIKNAGLNFDKAKIIKKELKEYENGDKYIDVTVSFDTSNCVIFKNMDNTILNIQKRDDIGADYSYDNESILFWTDENGNRINPLTMDCTNGAIIYGVPKEFNTRYVIKNEVADLTGLINSSDEEYKIYPKHFYDTFELQENLADITNTSQMHYKLKNRNDGVLFYNKSYYDDNNNYIEDKLVMANANKVYSFDELIALYKNGRISEYAQFCPYSIPLNFYDGDMGSWITKSGFYREFTANLVNIPIDTSSYINNGGLLKLYYYDENNVKHYIDDTFTQKEYEWNYPSYYNITEVLNPDRVGYEVSLDKKLIDKYKLVGTFYPKSPIITPGEQETVSWNETDFIDSNPELNIGNVYYGTTNFFLGKQHNNLPDCINDGDAFFTIRKLLKTNYSSVYNSEKEIVDSSEWLKETNRTGYDVAIGKPLSNISQYSQFVRSGPLMYGYPNTWIYLKTVNDFTDFKDANGGYTSVYVGNSGTIKYKIEPSDNSIIISDLKGNNTFVKTNTDADNNNIDDGVDAYNNFITSNMSYDSVLKDNVYNAGYLLTNYDTSTYGNTPDSSDKCVADTLILYNTNGKVNMATYDNVAPENISNIKNADFPVNILFNEYKFDITEYANYTPNNAALGHSFGEWELVGTDDITDELYNNAHNKASLLYEDFNKNNKIYRRNCIRDDVYELKIEKIDVPIKKYGCIKGKVLNPGNKAEANISIILKKKSTDEIISKSCIDSNGYYEFKDIDFGEYIIEYYYKDNLFQNAEIQINENSNVNITKNEKYNIQTDVNKVEISINIRRNPINKVPSKPNHKPQTPSVDVQTSDANKIVIIISTIMSVLSFSYIINYFITKKRKKRLHI